MAEGGIVRDRAWTRGATNLLAHDDPQSAAPAFRQADARAFQFGREKTQEGVRGRVEAQCRSNKINERRSGLQFDPREISIAIKIALFQMTADAKPIAGGL